MTSDPTADSDAIDRISAAFWHTGKLEAQIVGAEPLRADESFAIVDLTDEEWDAFARALHE